MQLINTYHSRECLKNNLLRFNFKTTSYVIYNGSRRLTKAIAMGIEGLTIDIKQGYYIRILTYAANPYL